MAYINDQILEALREARARKGLSQRGLSARSAVGGDELEAVSPAYSLDGVWA